MKENEFRFQNKNQVLLTLDICGAPYQFDVSPTNYGLIKKVAELSRETQRLLAEFNAKKKDTLFDMEKAFDFLKEKEQEIMEILLPGKWEELFKLAGQDLMNMVDLISFLAERIQSKGAKAKKDSLAPEVPQDAGEV